ncbi:transcriptional regulator [Sulfolobales archaeon SCGC AB-777_J03]|nr:transcriptional regulator [Sulfolobales archaeon SCGC AB-777_J03]
MDLVVEDLEDIMKVLEALSSITRVNILRMLYEEELSVTELSERLRLSKGTVSTHISVLESAGLVESVYVPGVKGVKKVIRPKVERAIIVLKPSGGLEEAYE